MTPTYDQVGISVVVLMFICFVWRMWINPALRKHEYQKALAALARDPESPDLYAQALAAGRAYNKALRKTDIQYYPEEAIRNDLKAATRRRRSA